MRLALLLGLIIGSAAAACFTETGTACSAGEEGCACVDEQCDGGLTCRDGHCVAAEGTSGGAMTSGTPTTDGETTNAQTSSESASQSGTGTDDGATDATSTSAGTSGPENGESESGTTSETGEVCACMPGLPACDQEFDVRADCGGLPDCCHTDGSYACICPFAPPCEWVKDECE